MASRFFTIGTLAVVTTMAAVAAVSTLRHPHLRPSVAAGSARLHAFGSRSLQQSQSAAGAKFDGALADLSRHAAQVRPGHAIEDLQSLAPAARFKQGAGDAAPLVLIDAVTRGNPQALKAALVGLGLQHGSVYSNDVGGWLPVAQLNAATAASEVHSIRAAMSRTRTGAVTSQGDFAQHSSVVRAANSLDGTGVTVGVLSDSFDCYSVYAANHVSASGTAGYANNGFTADYATDVTTLDLPSGVNVLEEAEAGNGGCMNYDSPYQLPFSDEGRAMLQIVHDVAPGAKLAFYTAENSEADFASGIGKLAAPVASSGAGAKVIADDVGYFDEPIFQDGIVAQAINAVEALGVAYFSAAGNDGTLAYDNTAPKFSTVSTTAPNSGESLLNFDASGATTTTSLPVTIAPLIPGEYVAIVVEWDQPYVTGAPSSSGATSRLDLCITGASGTDEIIDYAGNTATCSGPNALGVDSYQVMIVGNPANATGNTKSETLNIQLGLADGTAAPGRLILLVEDDGAGSTINAFQTNSPTLQGHPSAAGAAAVGAAFFANTPACGTSPALLEDFSSAGGSPTLFDSSGTRLASPMVRQKPDFVGPDGGNDTFLGFKLANGDITDSSTITACLNNANYPNFFGTSAATPHVASIAALMLQQNSALTPTQIYQALRISALPMATSSPNFDSGYGFVQADLAFIAPVMSLTANAVAVGGSTTLTWSAVDAASCVASGSWPTPGGIATSGTQTVTIATPGTNTYTLTCTNAAGASVANSVTLTDTAPVAPTLTLTKSAINLGQPVGISWSSVGATSCAASGSWSGTLPASGSQTVIPATGGTDTYSLTCTNALGTSSASTASVTVAPPPVPPTLTLAKTSIAAGASTTITWSSANATACTASGSWSGTLATSGTQTLTPTTAGTDTYTLTCANSAGKSAATSVTLTVTAAASSGSTGTLTGHGGGGAMDGITLLALAGIGMTGFFRVRRRVAVRARAGRTHSGRT
jgi:Subtilase family